MAFEVKMPQLGTDNGRRHGHQMGKAGRRRCKGRRCSCWKLQQIS